MLTCMLTLALAAVNSLLIESSYSCRADTRQPYYISQMCLYLCVLWVSLASLQRGQRHVTAIAFCSKPLVQWVCPSCFAIKAACLRQAAIAVSPGCGAAAGLCGVHVAVREGYWLCFLARGVLLSAALQPRPGVCRFRVAADTWGVPVACSAGLCAWQLWGGLMASASCAWQLCAQQGWWLEGCLCSSTVHPAGPLENEGAGNKAFGLVPAA